MRLHLLAVSAIAIPFLALNGCHYYVKMMPDVTISSQPFPVPQNNHLPSEPETIVLQLPTVKVPNTHALD